MTDEVPIDLADRFWAACGGAPEPPRDLLGWVSLALPMSVIVLPELTLGRIEAWLAVRGLDHRFGVADRRLHGCLVATGGHGFAFVDETDPSDERRFTLAHEVAHFLLDYQLPRDRAMRMLGEEIEAVLDGKRAATVFERLDAALSESSLVVRTHLMERTGDAGAHAAHYEERADRLGWELLAPAAEVCHVAGVDNGALERILIERYGLPILEAEQYARVLRRCYAPSPSYLEWLRE